MARSWFSHVVICLWRQQSRVNGRRLVLKTFREKYAIPGEKILEKW